ncbi:hypothetical protein FQA39_LY02722 [Lamprigera yunnana]|nr:hypothetical protein FQA39_LY02722 [Lamprigera yunnana]
MEEKHIIHGPEPYTLLEGDTLGEVFYNALKKHCYLPEAMVQAETKRKISYKDLLAHTCHLAQSIKEWGITPKDVIAVCSENSIEFCMVVIASFYLGVPCALINNNYTERELSNIVELAEPSIVFCSAKALSRIVNMKNKYRCINKIVVLSSNNVLTKDECLKSFLQNSFNKNTFTPASFNSDERVALIMCSSGTTGLPKAVEITHTNFRIRLIHSQDPSLTAMYAKGSSVLQIMPMFHSLGLSMSLSHLLSGYRIIIKEQFEPNLFLECIQNYKVVFTVVVPPLFLFLANHPLVDEYDLSSLKHIGSGGAPLLNNLCAAVQNKIKGVTVIQGYGLTETTSAIILKEPGNTKLGTIGKVGSLITAKIIDIDSGENLGPNKVGELCFKGPTVMKGYLKNQKATDEAIDRNGWLHSGDIGYYDEDCDFYIVDRLKDLIKYKGFQVSPSELEYILLEHPCIQDVGVFPLSDQAAGELPAACIVLQPGKTLTKEEVQDFVIGR